MIRVIVPTAGLRWCANGPTGPRGLRIRQPCNHCGAVHDRDDNVVITFRELGVTQLLPAGSVEVKRVESGGCTCGPAASGPMRKRELGKAYRPERIPKLRCG